MSIKRVLALIGIIVVSNCWAAVGSGKGYNPEAIEQVAAGEVPTANASWWGFDAADATTALQAAIDSKAKTVIVPYMGEPWTVRPIFLRSNLELVFEPGVILLAKKGEFRERWDCLLTAIGQEDITIHGYNTVLRMRKRDYRNPPYPAGEEWKHVLKIGGSRRIRVEGLRIQSSGGDGIYIGTGAGRSSEDIVIRDCVSQDNHRQGISITDVKTCWWRIASFRAPRAQGHPRTSTSSPTTPNSNWSTVFFATAFSKTTPDTGCSFVLMTGSPMELRRFRSVSRTV